MREVELPYRFEEPFVHDDNRFFFDACNEGRLLIQQCDDCSTYRFPPVPWCSDCGSRAFTPRESSGKATVYSFTVHRHPVSGRPPYTVIIGLLDTERVHIVSSLLERVDPSIDVGAAVRVVIARDARTGLAGTFFELPGEQQQVP